MNRFSNLLIKSIGALTLTGLAACDYIHDDSIAPCEYRLRLVYDYNMKFADAFQREVDKAALFICDNKGNFIRRQDIEGAELKANSIAMDLEPGTYQVLTWAGLDESSYQWPELTPESSTIEEIRVKTLREADATQPNELTPLWHALDTLVITGDRHEEKEISLAKNTNKLRVVLQDTEGYSMDVKDFSFRIVADNGYMDYDNTLLDDDTISYLPYHTESVDIAAGSADDQARQPVRGRGRAEHHAAHGRRELPPHRAPQGLEERRAERQPQPIPPAHPDGGARHTGAGIPGPAGRVLHRILPHAYHLPGLPRSGPRSRSGA